MAETNIKPTNAPSIVDLLDTIKTMDALSREGFSQIGAIASLALLAMKDPAHSTDNVVHALRVIIGKARDIEECISYEAELVGGNYVDPDRRQGVKAIEVSLGADAGATIN